MRPVILFAHGSGAGHDHPWMQRWRLRLSDLGEVFPLTYAYMQEGRRIPSPVARLEIEHLKRATALAREHRNRPLLFVGKSLGSRVSVMVADRSPAVATVAFGYPLVSRGRKATRREAPLRDTRVPTLLVQGTRDPMGPIPDLVDLVADHPTQSLRLRTVDDGDHSLECRKRPLRLAGRNQDDVDDEILYDIRRFLRTLVDIPGA
jgi:hypothetical protein